MTGLYHFFKTAGAAILLITLIASVWYYGSVTADALRWMVIALAASGGLGLLTLLTAPKLMQGEINLLRLGLFGLFLTGSLLFAFVQMMPLKPELVRNISPHIGELSDTLLPVPGSEEEQIESGFLRPEDTPILERGWPHTLSIQANATARAFPLLAVSGAAFLLAGIFFRNSSDRRVFWFLIMINGTLMGLGIFFFRTGWDFGLLQKIWPSAGCPPYVNRNNAAGYLVLCLGPALGFLASGMTEALVQIRQKNHLTYAGHTMQYQKKWHQRLSDSCFELADAFTHRLIFRLLAVAFLMTAAAVTLSRGGTLAALFAFITALCLVIRTGGSGKTALVAGLAVLTAFYLVCSSGMNEKIQDRFTEISEKNESGDLAQTDSRVVQWKAALATSQQYYWQGSGYGTYPLANRVREIENQYGLYFAYAENQAVQAVLESGWIGILNRVLYFSLIIMVILRLTSSKRRPAFSSQQSNRLSPLSSDSDPMLFGLGMGAVLAGQAVAASFDYGLCLAANAVLFSALCGNFLSFSDRGELMPLAADGERRSFLSSIKENKNLIGTVLVAAELVLFLTALIGSERFLRQSLADDQTLEANQTGMNFDEIDISSLTAAIDALHTAADQSPFNPLIHQKLATLSILRGRYRLYTEWTEQNPDQAKIGVWNSTALEPLHQRIMTLIQANLEVGPKKYREMPAIQEDFREAMRRILLVRRLAPFEADIHTLYGLLLPLVSDSPEVISLTAAAANRAASLAPYDLRIQFESGVLLLLAGEDERACRLWRPVLERSPRFLPKILEPLLSTSKPERLAQRVEWAFPDEFSILEQVFHRIKGYSRPEAEQVLLKKMEAAIQNHASSGNAQSVRDTARLHYLSGRLDEACAEYARALETAPHQALWHAEYAQILQEAKDFRAAVKEYQTALLYDPGNKQYQQNLETAKKALDEYILDPPELRGIIKKKPKEEEEEVFPFR